MKTLSPGIEVNGIKISPEEINAEVQYHPAESLTTAKYNAMRALVVRELLIQRAAELGLCQHEEAIKNPDKIIEDLLAQEIEIPEADGETIRRYYDNNKSRFFTSPLFEVSHILFLAPPDNEDARSDAFLKAEKAIATLRKEPHLFEAMAKDQSACSSAKDGGRLGQISRGQTMPAFEAALFQMKAGDVSYEPVATEVGYHIIKVHQRADGQQLPFENVAEWITGELKDRSWKKAVHQYIQLLAGRSKISGFRMEGVKTPLIQ